MPAADPRRSSAGSWQQWQAASNAAVGAVPGTEPPAREACASMPPPSPSPSPSPNAAAEQVRGCSTVGMTETPSASLSLSLLNMSFTSAVLCPLSFVFEGRMKPCSPAGTTTASNSLIACRPCPGRLSGNGMWQWVSLTAHVDLPGSGPCCSRWATRPTPCRRHTTTTHDVADMAVGGVSACAGLLLPTMSFITWASARDRLTLAGH